MDFDEETRLRKEIFDGINAELVCCLPGEDSHNKVSHSICKYGYWAAQLAWPEGHMYYKKQRKNNDRTRTARKPARSRQPAADVPAEPG